MHCYLLGGWFANWSQVLVLAKFVVLHIAQVAVSSIPILWCSLCCIHSQLVTIERYNINAAFTFINLSFLLAILPKQCTSGWSCWTTILQGGQQHEENCLFVVEYLFTPEQTYHKNGERVESNTWLW